LAEESIDAGAVEQFLLKEWRPSPYERWWKEAQEADKKTDRSIQTARAQEPDIDRVRLLDCHIVGCGTKRQFNPLVGTGGNVGRRDLVGVFSEAIKLVRTKPPRSVQSWLRNALFAEPASLPDLKSAGTWFVYANERFNSGQKPSREKGWISPWAFLLAMEGVRLLRGGTGRRMGSRARPYAVFPFLCDGPSPATDGEIKLTRAEFWAPLWEHPANCAELEALLERGLARVGDRSARSPHEFALAARSAGVDGGVAAFVRFSLRQTTSAQVFEAIPGETVRVADGVPRESRLLLPLLDWMKFLPEPPSSTQRAKFRGLRGPVEGALIRVAEQPENPDRWQSLLLLLAAIQDRLDHNRVFRERSRPVPRLDPNWFDAAWPAPAPEILIARAIASIGAGSQNPLFVNVVGADQDRWGNRSFSKSRPNRAVYHLGDPARVLADIVERRLADAEPLDPLPLGGAAPCSPRMIEAFLSGAIDLESVVRWLPAMVLIGWCNSECAPERFGAASSFYVLQALFRPLFHPRMIVLDGQPLLREPPEAATARRLLHLIRSGDWAQAIDAARARYLAAGRQTITPPAEIEADGERMAAALLIPTRSADVSGGIARWLEPRPRRAERQESL
jgi:CRISPR-associated protein Csx17